MNDQVRSGLIEAQISRAANYLFEQLRHFFCQSSCLTNLRYAAQNATVLEEAQLALITGEVRTPLIPSPQTSEGGDGDAAPTSDPVSSGEQYEKSITECHTPAKSSTVGEGEEGISTDNTTGSTDSFDEESYTTSTTTTSCNNPVSVEEDNNSIPDTSYTEQTSEVCVLNLCQNLVLGSVVSEYKLCVVSPMK